MSVQNMTSPEKNVVEFEFTISKEDFDAAVNKVYKRTVAKMTVPGFRKGKAPKAIVEKMYGKGVFYEDALNDLIPDAFTAALKESGAVAVSRPEFDIVTIDDNGVVMKAKFFVKPEVEIKNYSGIPVVREAKAASDADVEEELNRVRERNARRIDVVDRPAQQGDIAVIDYDGYCDGVAFEGGKAEGHNLTLGSGQFIPGFEDQIVGHNVGDAFDVNVTFPTEYHAAELAGKDATFKVVLHGIKFNELPELDDEFAKDVSEFDTLDEYKADIKAKIQDRNNAAADSAVEEELINALLENLEADVPEAMYEAEQENCVRDYDNRLRMQGLDLKTYFQFTGMDLDALRSQFRPQAERQVKTRLALEKIVELEGITVTDEEIEEEFQRISTAYGVELADVKAQILAEDLAKDLQVQKAVKFVKDNAKVTDKAAKKPRKKKAAAPAEEAPAEEAPAEDKAE